MFITRILLVNKLGIAGVLSGVSCRQSRLVGVTARRCDDPGGNSGCEGSLLVLWVVTLGGLVTVGWSLSLYSGLTTTGLCASLNSRGYGGAGLGDLY